MANQAEKIKARFAAEGLSVAEWAAANGFSRHLVYRVIHGKTKCSRGQAHRIALALGLKNEPKKLIFRPSVEAA